MFSQFARKILFSGIKHIYITIYIVYTCFPTVSAIFANVLILRSWEGAFITFVFLWPTTISPRNASRKLVTTQDGKGLIPITFPLQVIFALLANSWCPERSFQTKTISSGYLGEYKFCYML